MVQRRGARELPMIDDSVDAGWIFDNAGLGTLAHIEIDGVMEVERAVGAHPIGDLVAPLVLGPGKGGRFVRIVAIAYVRAPDDETLDHSQIAIPRGAM